MLDREKRLNEVYEYLHNNFNVHTKGDFADSIKYARAYVSSALNGNERYLTDKLFRNICDSYPNVFDLNYLLSGEGSLLTAKEEEIHTEDVQTPKVEIPDFIQRLFDESVRMQTRSELLERQCEQLIAELRESKDKNESFLSELRQSKEYNDTLVADLKISRVQNETLITELRETRKENHLLTSKLSAAIDGIESMKNQFAMIISQYSNQQPPTYPMKVNEDDGSIRFVIHDVIGHDTKSKKKMKDQIYALVPQGLIRGGRITISNEILEQAVEAFKKDK